MIRCLLGFHAWGDWIVLSTWPWPLLDIRYCRRGRCDAHEMRRRDE